MSKQWKEEMTEKVVIINGSDGKESGVFVKKVVVGGGGGCRRWQRGW